MSEHWKWGDKVAVATAAGISRQQLNEIIQRRCRVTDRALADKLEFAAGSLGHYIPWRDWMLNTQTDNKYFNGKE